MGQPTWNVIARNNQCNGPGNGICVGSEMAGGVDNVYAKNNMITASSGTAINFKSNLDRGAWIRNVVVDGLQVGHVGSLLGWTNNYRKCLGCPLSLSRQGCERGSVAYS